jgi:NADH:ubiquinone oxidoreductase subunit H
MMLPRSVMPRTRLDILIRAGWVKLLALSFANLFLTMVIVSLGLVK